MWCVNKSLSHSTLSDFIVSPLLSQQGRLHYYDVAFSYCIYIIVNLPLPAVCPQAQMTSVCSDQRESIHNHWLSCVHTHIYTHIQEMSPICQTHIFALWHRGLRMASGIFVSEIHALTHTHAGGEYSCWCLRLVAALKLAHICSCIDPPALCGERECVRVCRTDCI